MRESQFDLLVYVGRVPVGSWAQPADLAAEVEGGRHVAIFLVGGSSPEELEVHRSFAGRDVYVTCVPEDNLKQSVVEELEYARFWFGVPDNGVVRVVCGKGLHCQEFVAAEAA